MKGHTYLNEPVNKHFYFYKLPFYNRFSSWTSGLCILAQLLFKKSLINAYSALASEEYLILLKLSWRLKLLYHEVLKDCFEDFNLFIGCFRLLKFEKVVFFWVLFLKISCKNKKNSIKPTFSRSSLSQKCFKSFKCASDLPERFEGVYQTYFDASLLACEHFSLSLTKYHENVWSRMLL